MWLFCFSFSTNDFYSVGVCGVLYRFADIFHRNSFSVFNCPVWNEKKATRRNRMRFEWPTAFVCLSPFLFLSHSFSFRLNPYIIVQSNNIAEHLNTLMNFSNQDTRRNSARERKKISWWPLVQSWIVNLNKTCRLNKSSSMGVCVYDYIISSNCVFLRLLIAITLCLLILGQSKGVSFLPYALCRCRCAPVS